MDIMEDPYPGATPEQREKCVTEVRAFIDSSPGIPPELKAELGDRAGFFVEVVERRGGKYYGGQLGWSYWAIRNDHLKLVEALAAAAIAITTYAAVATAAPAVLAVTLLFGAAALADKLRKKSASLEEEGYRVLMTLKQTGPVTAAKLSDALNGTRIYGLNMWTENRTDEALRKLQAVRLGDGSVEALVNQASDGLWSASGI
jgi:hypothetical protein